MKKMLKAISILAVAGLTFGAASFAAEADAIIEARQDNFQSLKKNFQALSKILGDSSKKDESLKLLKAASANAEKIYSFFPPESKEPNEAESDAAPEIWDNLSDFKTKADTLVKSISNLTQAVQKGDTSSFEKLGKAVQQSCKACHEEYRD